MKNVIMIDIETTGKKPGCRILSIGAFGFSKNGEQCEFYSKMDPSKMEKDFFTDDKETMEWWEKQTVQAREEAFGGTEDPVDAIARFKMWFIRNFDVESRTCKFEAWSCGIDFDFPIMEEFMRFFGFAAPWKFWQKFDYRTIKNCFPGIKMFEQNGAKHTALEDAKAQMRGLRAFKNKEY